MMSTTASVGRPGRFRAVLLIIGTLLVLYGGLGLLLNLHLPQRLLQGWALWRGFVEAGQLLPPDAPYEDMPAWFEAVSAHFDGAVLPVWLSWGVGILLLLLAAGRRPGTAALPRRPLSWRDAVALAVLAGIVFLGYNLRARFLLPLSDQIVPISHYDEMVYLEGALLWRNGLQPYGDFFLAHPPGILYAFWPAVSVGELWGGPAVLAAGRIWQCVAGLLTVALLYLVGREIAGRRGGLLAALILALDIQAVQVAPLETVVNLVTVAALGLYLAALKVSRRWVRFLLLALAGGLATLGGLTKVPGGVTLLLLALLALLAGQWRDLLAGAVGAAATALLVAGPFVFRTPGAFWRQVVAFQMLRPQETLYGRNHLARMADYPESRLTFLLLAASVVLLTVAALVESWRALSERGGRRASAGPGGWALPLALAIVLLLALFSYGRAYHSRYYVQLIVPFALLVAVGLGAVLSWARRWRLWGRMLALVVAAAFLALSWPHLGQQGTIAEPHPVGLLRYDGTYGPLGRALREVVPAGVPVLALDPGYPLMAGRPPVPLPDGTRLVDGAGLMVYHALGISGMSPGQVWASALEASREINPTDPFHRPAAQDLVVSALRGAGASVIDPRIAAEDLTPQTQEFLATRGTEITRVQFTAAFTVERVACRGRNRSGLCLWDLNMRPFSSTQGEGRAVVPGEVLEVHLGEALQVSLYWYVEQSPAGPVKVSLELRDELGKVVVRRWEPPHFGDPPADVWQAGWVYQDHHNLPIAPDLRLGEYTLYVDLLDADSGAPWPWEEGIQVDAGLPVGVVRLVR